MESLFLVLTLIVSLLLIAVVLIQPGKADMISGMGGLGGQMTNLIGVRQSRNVLQSLTIGFAVFLVVAAIIVNKFFVETGGSTEAKTAAEGATIPNIERTTQLPATPAPGQQPAQP
jgi:protein translocase SecG subunit